MKELFNALEKIKTHDHICLIYMTREEQFAVAIPFMQIGLGRGERCVYIADDNTSVEVLDAMRKAGIDTDTAVRSGALAVLHKREAYLKQGSFDPDWMIRFLKEAADSAKGAGFTSLRVAGEMTWVLGGDPGAGRLIEYEAKLNYFFPENDVSAICQYNLNRFKPEVILDVVRTHPLVIYRNQVCKNFYYVPPDELLLPDQKSREVERLLNNIAERERIEKSRQETENELRKREQMLYEMIKNSPLPMMISEKNLKIHYVNKKFTEVFGYTVDDIPTVDKWWQLVAPERGYKRTEKERWSKAVDKAIQDKTSIEPQEALVKCKQGFLRDVIFYFSSIGERDLVIYHDLTERKRSEEALMESREELKKYNIELKAALDKVKLLSGLLPICASCKKIRNDKGYWEGLEKYIASHSEAEFSHSICPVCAERLYPEYKEQLS